MLKRAIKKGTYLPNKDILKIIISIGKAVAYLQDK